ncbi:MAG TPA: LytR C-terminal domain-containing protein [Lapillicoccus sp.]|nr:LytR C-terminal domain-containing protein [Lapillicoccus sp.]
MARPRDERGVVFPSPVVMLSIIAVAMAGISYVATRNQQPVHREVTVAHAQPQPSASADPSSAAPTLSPHKPKKIRPEVERGNVYVEVYNNSGITGLAGRVAAKASGAGWQVVGSDNWYGTIPASTVYYPARLEPAAKLLALDLGIHRVEPAVDPMRLDRLTVILTGPLG